MDSRLVMELVGAVRPFFDPSVAADRYARVVHVQASAASLFGAGVRFSVASPAAGVGSQRHQVNPLFTSLARPLAEETYALLQALVRVFFDVDGVSFENFFFARQQCLHLHLQLIGLQLPVSVCRREQAVFHAVLVFFFYCF